MNWDFNYDNGNAENVLASFGQNNAYRELERRYTEAIEESRSEQGVGIASLAELSLPLVPEQFKRIYPLFTEHVALPQNAARLRPDEATAKTKASTVSLAHIRVKQVVSDLLFKTASSKFILDSYMSEGFHKFLDEVNKVPEFSDTLVTQYVKQLFWHLDHALGLPQIPNPQALPSESDTLALWWQLKMLALAYMSITMD